MPFLAQQFPTNGHELTILIVLNVIIGLAVTGVAVAVGIKKLGEKPPEKPKDPLPLPTPLVTQRYPDYVPRHEFNRLEGQVMGLAGRIEAVHSDLLQAGELRADGIHKRLNDLIEPLAEIRGRVHALTDAMKVSALAHPSPKSSR